jgi:hypothetical protein
MYGFSKRVAELKRVNSKGRTDKFLAVFYIEPEGQGSCVFADHFKNGLARCFLAVVYIFLPLALAHASDITPQKIIDLANADRADKGVYRLTENDKLDKAAEDKAGDMVAKNYFSHNSPEGVNPWHWFEKENYDYSYAGENLAMDFTSADKMNQAWLDSPTHRANIMNSNFREIGVSVREGAIGGHQTIVVVQLFGSGDNNSKEETVENNLNKKEIVGNENFAPFLPPASDDRSAKTTFAEPLITNPQRGEVISEKNIEVIGSAMPGSRVILFDNSTIAGQSFADQKGWFRIKLDNLAEGGHKFRVQGDEMGGRKEINILQQEVFFSIDRTKPKVNYQLYASNDSREYLISLSSNKANCTFELNGMKISTKERKKIFVTIPANRIASALKVEDEAGNKTIKEINLVNYFQGEKKADLINKFAGAFSPEKVFTAESGRDALMKNLGIAMERYNN